MIDGQRVFAAVTVLLKVERVLRSAYGYQAAGIVHALRVFAGLPTVMVEDGAMVAAALDLAERGNGFRRCSASDHSGLLRRKGSSQ
ncbi:hypothetical protein BCCGELA001_13485 [Bradyrhizobium sp. CCGE-LA001]|nr:hypothetical protein BCCGELA001_13485 [Bradyrhizobium sp. CCGE-LA001]